MYMRSKSKTEIAITLTLDAIMCGVLIWYFLSLNPSTRLKLQVGLQWLRWYVWSLCTPSWYKEALMVRGFTGVE